MSGTLDLSALAAALSALPGYRGTTAADLAVLNVKGLAHDHVTLAGRGLLLRVPKLSQFALSGGVPHGSRCPASPRHALLAENPGKPSLGVNIEDPWYYSAASLMVMASAVPSAA
jgi:hypothetical protein